MKIKKIVSTFLALIMIVSSVPFSAIAASATGTYQLVAGSVEVDGSSDKTVDVYFQSVGSETTYMMQAAWLTSEQEGTSYLKLTSLTPAAGITPTENNANNGSVVWSDLTFTGVSTPANGTIWTATYTVDKNTPAGTYTVGVTGKTTDKTWGENNFGTLTATINVTAPEQGGESTSDYEIYYTLDKEDGTDADKYHDYQIGDTVTATVYLKNNTDNAVILQAYDIYLDYAPGLLFESSAMTGAVALINGSNEDKSTEEGAAVTHIEAVAEKYKNVNVENRTVPANGALPLGTISFTFDSNNADVKYDTQLKLGFKVAKDETNGDKEIGITNFSIGAATTGDKKAYYPMLGDDILGAEVKTTYAVNYDANTTETVTGMPAAQTKEYNKPLTLSSNVPVRTGYTFDGWNTAANCSGTAYAEGAQYTENAAVTLYAQWTQNTFTVKWHNAAGEVIETDTGVVHGSAPVFDGTNPEKTDTAELDYKFIGWNTDANATTALNLTQQQITADTNYYPIYTSVTQTYTVTWVNYNGDVLETDEEVPYGTTPTYNSGTPQKPATTEKVFTFDTWTPTVSAVTGAVTYTATFTEADRSYTVTYAAGTQGTLSGNTTESVVYNQKPSSAPTVTPNAGYKFVGWSDGETTYTDLNNCSVTGDVTLTAQYELEEYTITLNVNGGNTLGQSTITYKITDTVTLPKPTKTGSGFDGWKLETATGSWEAKTYSAGDYNNQYGSITLVAQWSNNTYQINQGSVTGGTVAPSQNSANYGNEITLSNDPADGYTFDHYVVTAANGDPVTVTDGKFTMPASDVTISAVFNAIDYTVTIGTISNGKVTASKTTQVHVGDVITLTPAANTGYKWTSYTVTYKDANDVDQTATVTNNQFTMPAANVTVNATFEGISYTIQYNNNGGNGTMADSAAVYGNGAALSQNIFTKTGYHFLGWATSADGEVDYGDKADGSRLTTNEGDVVTLYAVWEADTNTAYVVNHYKQDLANNVILDTYTKEETENLTGTSDAKVKPAVKNYEGFTAPAVQEVTINADGSTEVNYYYDRKTYTVKLDANYDGGADSTITVIYGSTYVGLPTLSRNGYTFNGWFTAAQDGTQVNTTDPVGVVAEGTTLYAHWSVVTYKVTLIVPEDNRYNNTTVDYTIEAGGLLPTPANGLYTFAGWKVTKAVGNWEAGAEFDPGQFTPGFYGGTENVELTAQWEFTLSYKVEDYKYAYDPAEGTDGYKLLIVTNNLDSDEEYKFDGASMFFTSDENYRVIENDTRGVFYYLIPEAYVGADNKLTATGIAKLAVADAGTRATINYTNYDINDDGVVNIADANVVYQMVINGGSYYSMDQLGIEARLRADFNTATTDTTNEHRASIADVNVVVNVINGVTAPNA